MNLMERSVRVFDDPSEAELEDLTYWRRRTPQERIDLLRELLAIWIPQHERRLKRSFEIVEVP